MRNYLIRNAYIVNEGRISTGDLLVKNGRIEKIGPNLQPAFAVTEINGDGKFLLPGVIDDQVHFREPGLTHKATIYTEAKAAVAGGVTSFMEMPNTIPPAFTQDLLEDKYAIGARSSLANYSFYMGTSNDNAEEALRTNEKRRDVCGIKIFMGSSTGNLLVDNYLTLDRLFRESEVLDCHPLRRREDHPAEPGALETGRAGTGSSRPPRDPGCRSLFRVFAYGHPVCQKTQ